MSKALVIIDCQNGFMPEGESPVIDMPEAVKNIKKVLNGWNDLVIFTKYLYKRSPNPIIDINPKLCPPNSISSEIVDELRPFIERKNALIIEKFSYSGFEGTGLEAILKKSKIHEIFLAGVTTDCCVLSTAFDAYDKRIAVRVIKECVASADAHVNEVVLKIIKDSLESDFVISMDDIITNNESD